MNNHARIHSDCITSSPFRPTPTQAHSTPYTAFAHMFECCSAVVLALLINEMEKIMRGRSLPIRRLLVLSVTCALITMLTARQTWADVFGRLQFSVKNAADEKPLANAKITLKDSANVRPDVTLTTDAQGSATSRQLEIPRLAVTTTAEKPTPLNRTPAP